MAEHNLSTALAVWSHDLTWNRIPREVLHETKLRILDITGAMLGGRHAALIDQIGGAVFADNAGSGTPVIGFDSQSSVAGAALLQGTMACVLEYDDSHVTTGIHPTSPVAAAAIAYGQQTGISGRALIESVLIGNETLCRLGLAAPGKFHRVGFHPTGVLGVFGAGYASARLAALDPAKIVNAIGICGSFSSGIMASWEDGTAAKSLHAGWAASSALQAVQLAKAGVSGPLNVYEGRFGFYRSHVQDQDFDFDYHACLSGLGERWEAMNIAPRAYPCGHYIQPFIDAALTVARNNEITADDITEIVCLVADYMVPLICEPAQEKIHPASSWHARYSLPFCVAECFLTGGFTKFSLASDDLINESYIRLCKKVRYDIDPAAGDRTKWSGEVRVTVRSGKQFSHRVEDMHGTPGNPITQDELIEKFLHNTSGVLTGAEADQCIDRLLKLDAEPDIRSVFRPLCANTV